MARAGTDDGSSSDSTRELTSFIVIIINC